MASKRGNPTWGKIEPYAWVALPSAFEQVVKKLHLQPDQYLGSKELRNWAKRNMGRHFVPEYLLHSWDLHQLPD